MKITNSSPLLSLPGFAKKKFTDSSMSLSIGNTDLALYEGIQSSSQQLVFLIFHTMHTYKYAYKRARTVTHIDKQKQKRKKKPLTHTGPSYRLEYPDRTPSFPSSTSATPPPPSVFSTWVSFPSAYHSTLWRCTPWWFTAPSAFQALSRNSSTSPTKSSLFLSFFLISGVSCALVALVFFKFAFGYVFWVSVQ